MLRSRSSKFDTLTTVKEEQRNTLSKPRDHQQPPCFHVLATRVPKLVFSDFYELLPRLEGVVM